MPLTESGESGVQRSIHVNAAIALRLQRGCFGAGQHRIPDVPVIHEHGIVVAPHRSMIAAR